MPELLQALDAAQRALLALLAALGWTDTVHGQPGWPLAHRLALETFAIDRALLRQWLATLTGCAAALLLLLAAWLLRHRRPRIAAAGAVLAVALPAALPWPAPTLWLTPASPTSFHRPPAALAATSAPAIVAGAPLFQAHCTSCHGAQGRGDGPQAGRGGMWPPDLTGALLWRRSEGELFWRLQHGLRDHRGRPTMAGFAGLLDDTQTWAVLAWLQANAAGQTLQREGVWRQPVPLPDLRVQCERRGERRLRGWTSQRVRVLAVGDGAQVREDPRVVTVALAAPGARVQAECVARDAEGWQVFALLAGVAPQDLAGQAFLADRQGWLRARSARGSAEFSEDDLICKSEGPVRVAGAPAGGLDAVIARMDAEVVRVVRVVRGGVVH